MWKICKKKKVIAKKKCMTFQRIKSWSRELETRYKNKKLKKKGYHCKKKIVNNFVDDIIVILLALLFTSLFLKKKIYLPFVDKKRLRETKNLFEKLKNKTKLNGIFTIIFVCCNRLVLLSGFVVKTKKF